MNRETESNRSNIENLLKSIKSVNSQADNVRLNYLFEKFIDHFCSFAKETKLNNDEWLAVLDFLRQCGQHSTSTRQELILLSDVLGLSSIIDSLNHPKPDGATQSTVLGPFHTEDAPHLSNGDSIASQGRGEPTLFIGSVSDTNGKPIEGIEIDVWETDATGHYDNQYEDRQRPDLRAILTSDSAGTFSFRCVRPVSYAVPTDGPVGQLLHIFHREAFRPAHIHFYLKDPKQIYEDLVTSLFIRGDPHESNDAVFGIKTELIVDIQRIENIELAKQYELELNDWLIRFDFVLTKSEQTATLR